MKKILTLTGALMVVLATTAQQRKEVDLRDGWQFSKDGKQWQTVTIPHDWAISGPFDKKWDLQMVAIEQNGEKEATEKSGRSGALPWIGEGEYRTTFVVPNGYEKAVLLFDGAMSEPVVYVNGHEAGHWAYGYNAFRVDATPYLSFVAIACSQGSSCCSMCQISFLLIGYTLCCLSIHQLMAT